MKSEETQLFCLPFKHPVVDRRCDRLFDAHHTGRAGLEEDVSHDCVRGIAKGLRLAPSLEGSDAVACRGLIAASADERDHLGSATRCSEESESIYRKVAMGNCAALGRSGKWTRARPENLFVEPM